MIVFVEGEGSQKKNVGNPSRGCIYSSQSCLESYVSGDV